MNEPREQNSPALAVRASDGERERVAKLVSDAAGEGRLTLAEAEERLDRLYATRFRHELADFVADLPAREDERPAARRPAATGLAGVPARLRVHAAVAVVLSVFLITRWIASDAAFFWPAGPMFFLFGSLLLHARVAYWSRRPLPDRFRRWELRPSAGNESGGDISKDISKDAGKDTSKG
ncbi:MAG TPA: DUF1707 domain-containing protein [Actinophytocola sp.]|jgi:hypothetical protein|nr:DUF1707 domain-containing protein [Actinophytocola sp.]